MRKTQLAALLASAIFATGAAQAGLTISLDGSGGNTITATGLDWSQSSLVAQGANQAAIGWAAGAQGADGTCFPNCTFEVMTMAKLTSYTPVGGSAGTNLPGGFTGEITMVTRFTEKVVSALPGQLQFATTGAGWIEFYYSSAKNSNALTGANFNDGILIGQLIGTNVGASGFFFVGPNEFGDLSGNLDQNGADDYAGQQTLYGFGGSQTLSFGASSKELDGNFFKTQLAGFAISFSNISTQLPNDSVDPSDCYNDTKRAAGTVGSPYATQCLNNHNAAKYAGQDPDNGYVPDVGDTNVEDLEARDFVAQTDFNSSVKGVPEPASIALLGLALGGLGLTSRRRKAAR